MEQLTNMNLKGSLSEKELGIVASEFEKRKKSQSVAWVLWLFTGGIGGHRFYLGDTGYAICMLLFNWATFGVWSLIDAFFINKNIRKKNEEIEMEIIRQVKVSA